MAYRVTWSYKTWCRVCFSSALISKASLMDWLMPQWSQGLIRRAADKEFATDVNSDKMSGFCVSCWHTTYSKAVAFMESLTQVIKQRSARESRATYSCWSKHWWKWRMGRNSKLPKALLIRDTCSRKNHRREEAKASTLHHTIHRVRKSTRQRTQPSNQAIAINSSNSNRIATEEQ